jgi:hypothetical protein
MWKLRERAAVADQGDTKILFTVVTIDLPGLDHSCGPDCHCWKGDPNRAEKTTSKSVSSPSPANHSWV